MFKDNPDLFPTPIELQHRMFRKLDWTKIKNCLEPTAGKGDLLEGIKKQFEYTQRYRQSKKYDIDTVEIDNSLQMILKGKGYRLIHDNFLTFHTYKRYDAIIANFPFSIGDKCLIKAIQMQERGGSIVALINAETIRNPYSNSRKELIRLLEKYDADVEFIENAFVNSERSTGVTVALITIHIEKNEYNSTIINELNKEKLNEQSKEYNSDQLIHSDFIEGIVSQYNYEIKAGLKLIDEYNSLRPYILGSFDRDSPVLKLELDYKDDGSTLENGYIKQIRAKYWKALFSNDQFIGLFTSNLKTKYMEMVEELKDYDFSFYNIYSLRIQLSKEMVQGVEDTILSLFDELSHKHHYYDESSGNVHLWNGWKSNSAYKINSKVIIPLAGFHDMQYSWGRYEPTHYKCLDKLKDIEKVFNYLDQGNTKEIDLKEALNAAEKSGKTKKIETRYFFITFYKKGSCHLQFKNMDLLHKFNLTAAKHKMWLPPSYGKVKYTDMSVEEKEVINQFEGKESYNKVYNNQSYYILKAEELLKLTS